jgi:RNA-binding protein 26
MEAGDKERLDSELQRLGMETTAGKDQEELMQLNAQLSALKDKVSLFS